MPHSRPLGDELFELRFDLGWVAQRITFFFPAGSKGIVMLTVFRKQRSNERAVVARARLVMRRCVSEGHSAEDEEWP